MKRIIVGLVFLFTACGGENGTADAPADGEREGHEVTGTVEVTGDWDAIAVMEPGGKIVSIANSRYKIADGQWCQGTGGYDDMSEGNQVRIIDAANELLAFGDLQPGTLTKLDGPNYLCTLTFTVAGVPDTDTYQVEVSDRGALLFSHADMEASGWSVGLTLG